MSKTNVSPYVINVTPRFFWRGCQVHNVTIGKTLLMYHPGVSCVTVAALYDTIRWYVVGVPPPLCPDSRFSTVSALT